MPFCKVEEGAGEQVKELVAMAGEVLFRDGIVLHLHIHLDPMHTRISRHACCPFHTQRLPIQIHLKSMWAEILLRACCDLHRIQSQWKGGGSMAVCFPESRGAPHRLVLYSFTANMLAFLHISSLGFALHPGFGTGILVVIHSSE